VTPAAGDRVAYTVMYHDGRGFGQEHIEHRTEYGTVTSTWPSGGPVMARIAVEDPRPGQTRYVTRKIRDITPAPTDADLAIQITAAINQILAAAAELETVARHARRAGHPQLSGQLESYTIPGLHRWGGYDPGQPGNLPQLLTALGGND
jgi:hypothetical protein